MSRGRSRETLARWWFSGLVMVLGCAGAAQALLIKPAPRVVEAPPSRVAHNPDPGHLDASVRDPFMTGTEWRAKVRERQEQPLPAPSASAGAGPVAAPPAPPPGSELGFAGTMVSGSVRYAILSAGMVKTGAKVGKYVVEQIGDDRIVLRFDDKRVTLRMTGAGVISTVTPGGTGRW